MEDKYIYLEENTECNICYNQYYNFFKCKRCTFRSCPRLSMPPNFERVRRNWAVAKFDEFGQRSPLANVFAIAKKQQKLEKIDFNFLFSARFSNKKWQDRVRFAQVRFAQGRSLCLGPEQYINRQKWLWWILSPYPILTSIKPNTSPPWKIFRCKRGPAILPSNQSFRLWRCNREKAKPGD